MPLNTKLARFALVVAYDCKGGIAKEQKLPWHYKEDLAFFKNITINHSVIMGRKTFDALPDSVRPLPNRRNIVLSKSLKDPPAGAELASSLLQALQITEKDEVYIIGGADIFHQVFSQYQYLCSGIYATEIKKDYACDTLMSLDFIKHCSKEKLYESEEYDRYLYKFNNVKHGEYEYLNLMRNILENGEHRADRTGTGTISLFGARMEFDLSQSIPVLTTKKVLFDKIVGELLWIISGSTNVLDLQNRGIHFWDANSTREFLDKRGLQHYEVGDLGPVYGFQWRHFGAEYEGCHANYKGKGFDQLADVVNLLKNDPQSRRILISAWNAADLSKMALPPCHLLVQFYVRNQDTLDCQLYQRSGDMFLGVPFNIASYSALTYMLAHVCNLKPGRFIHTLGDAHIYSNHQEAVAKQLERTPRPFPTLRFARQVSNIDDFTDDDFILENYESCPFIRAPMAV